MGENVWTDTTKRLIWSEVYFCILFIFQSPFFSGGEVISYSGRCPQFPLLLLLLSFQSCPTLCNRTNGSPPGSRVPGILQARTLEWVAISFSNAWKWKVKVKSLSCARLLVTPWTAAYQAPPSMGFSRQEYWSGVPLPSVNSTSILINWQTWNGVILSYLLANFNYKPCAT